MKKFFSFIALALFVILPVSVNATISVESPIDCADPVKTSTGEYYVKCNLRLKTTNGEQISNFEANIAFENSENQYFNEADVVGAGAFKTTVLGNTISFTADTPQSGEIIELGSFTYYVKDINKGCNATITPTSADVNPDPVPVEPTPENPKTGSAISYVAIGAGVLLIAGAYVISRKNTKMYKI